MDTGPANPASNVGKFFRREPFECFIRTNDMRESAAVEKREKRGKRLSFLLAGQRFRVETGGHKRLVEFLVIDRAENLWKLNAICLAVVLYT
jgi:hypothetical protein